MNAYIRVQANDDVEARLIIHVFSVSDRLKCGVVKVGGKLSVLMAFGRRKLVFIQLS